MAEEPAGFLGRWSRRKAEVLQGKKSPDLPVVHAADANAVVEPSQLVARDVPQPDTQGQADGGESTVPERPALSLDDTKLLTKDSDFRPFMARGVGEDVRNAAMKKLFADPQFNVMDRLDIYIDDYSKSDPIPQAMLRQMTSVKFLGIFDDEDEEENRNPAASAAGASSATRETAGSPQPEPVAQSDDGNATAPSVQSDLSAFDISSQPAPANLPPHSGASQEDHAYIDLRLQPDHAPPASKAGSGD
jgi:hypothetical protein